MILVVIVLSSIKELFGYDLLVAVAVHEVTAGGGYERKVQAGVLPEEPAVVVVGVTEGEEAFLCPVDEAGAPVGGVHFHSLLTERVD